MIDARMALCDPAAHALEWLSAEIAARGSTGAPLLLLASGGSALQALPEALPPGILPESVTLTVLDERACPDASNFAALSKTPLFSSATRRGAHAIDPRPRDGESAEAAARRFDEALRQFDARSGRRGQAIAVAGIGADGHTAGIFPLPADPALFATRFLGPGFAVGYDAGAGAPACRMRISATGTYVRMHLAAALIYAVGVEKAEAVAATLATEASVEAVPARLFHRIPRAVLMTDIGA